MPLLQGTLLVVPSGQVRPNVLPQQKPFTQICTPGHALPVPAVHVSAARVPSGHCPVTHLIVKGGLCYPPVSYDLPAVPQLPLVRPAGTRQTWPTAHCRELVQEPVRPLEQQAEPVVPDSAVQLWDRGQSLLVRQMAPGVLPSWHRPTWPPSHTPSYPEATTALVTPTRVRLARPGALPRINATEERGLALVGVGAGCVEAPGAAAEAAAAIEEAAPLAAGTDAKLALARTRRPCRQAVGAGAQLASIFTHFLSRP